MHPAAEIVGALEMRVVGGKRREALALGEELVEQVPAVAAVVLHRAAVIVDFHRMCGIDGAAILDRQLRPGGVSDADEGAGFAGPARQFGACLAFQVLRKVDGKARRHDVPELAHRRFRCMQLDAEQRGEIVGAEGPRVGDGEVEVLDEVFGELHEVIARGLVGIDHLPWFEHAVGEGRVGMQVAAPEASGR